MAYTTIDKPTDYFNTKLYTGNGSTNNITGVGFQPDFTWVKGRSVAQGNSLYDAIRGYNYKVLSSDSTSAEVTETGGVSAVISDGFSLNGNNTIIGGTNGSGQTYASWNWLAGGTASSNTDGSITSSVSANTTAGFSIVSYTGNGSNNQTVGHGLGVAPAVMIFKNRDDTNNWVVYHHKNTSAPATDYLSLNTTSATVDDATLFNDTAPTSSVFTIGQASDTGSGSGGNNEKVIAYCFAEKKGYSKFGSYTGNGNADGTFIYTGFKPAFVMTKVTDLADSWTLWDNKRDVHNVVTSMLRADTNQAEDTTTNYLVDFLSNGFKWRSADAKQNGSGNSYIYMCFAENPFVTSTGIPTTAR